MAFFKKLFGKGDNTKQKIRNFENLKRDKDPGERWQIVSELGDGAFGKVYKAKNVVDNIEGALKQIDIADEEELADYMVEINILTACKHKNIVGFLEAFYYNSKLSLYIEFCGGGALDSIMINLEHGLNEKQIARVVHELCEALVALHSKYVIHRDLKAGNILLTSDACVKLADFGVSAKNERSVQKRTTFIGTPFWMAPEVIACETLKENPYGVSADIWSLGITVIECAEMEPPNHDLNPLRVLIKISKADAPTLRIPSRWSKSMNRFVNRCLKKNPNDRPTAQDLLQDPFIANATDKAPLVELLAENVAEVEETLLDLDEDAEDLEIKRRADEANVELTGGVEPPTPDFLDDEPPPLPGSNGESLIQAVTPEVKPATPVPKVPEVAKPRTSEPVKKPIKPSTPEVKRSAPTPPEVKRSVPTPPEVKRSAPTPPPVVPPPEQFSSPKHDRKSAPPPVLHKPVVNGMNNNHQDKSKPEEIKHNDFEKRRTENKSAVVTTRSTVNEWTSQEKPEETQGAVAVKSIRDMFESRKTLNEPVSASGVRNRFSQSPPTSSHALKDDQMNQLLQALVSELVFDVVTCDDTSPSVPSVVLEVVNEMVLSSPPLTPTKTPPPIAPVVKSPPKTVSSRPNSAEKRRAEAPAQPPPVTVKQSTAQSDSVRSLRDAREPAQSTRREEPTPARPDGLTLASATPPVQRSIPSSQRSSTQVTASNSPAEQRKIASRDQAVVPAEGTIVTRKKREETNRRSHYRTLVKTRRVIKDGQVVNVRTERIVVAGQEHKEREEREGWRADMRQYKILQKTENRQLAEANQKARAEDDQLARKFELEKQNVIRLAEAEMETMSRTQKQKLEREEVGMNNERKALAKRVKQEQERELSQFREQLKQEMKLFKQQLQLSKSQGKETLRRRREEKDRDVSDKERQFLVTLKESLQKAMEQKEDEQRQKVAKIEKNFLEQKQQRRRELENTLWELEQRFLTERYQTAKRRTKEIFMLKRRQMQFRHNKELNEIEATQKSQTDEMTQRHSVELKRLPRLLKEESRARFEVFKQTLRANGASSSERERMHQTYVNMCRTYGINPRQDIRTAIAQFEESERRRVRGDEEKYKEKQRRQREALIRMHQNELSELEAVQKERMTQLLEGESEKIAIIDDSYAQEVDAWKTKLPTRKRELEEEFAEQLRQQELFYSSGGSSINAVPATQRTNGPQITSVAL